MFAKLFDTTFGQVVVFKQTNDDLEPEIRFYFEPKSLGVSSTAFSYSDDDDGWKCQLDGFDKITLEMAEAVAKQMSEFGL